MNDKYLPTRKDFLIFGSPLIEEDEIREVEATLRSGWIGTGPRVSKFEQMFQDYIGSKYSVALHSCTASLHLSMLAADIGPGDEVITTPMTFCATANSIIHTGAKPVFVDVEKDSMNIDPQQIEKAITEKTKAIVPVHFAGRACNMQAILKLTEKHKLKLISDCAHAIETEYHGQKVGLLGDLCAFSFYVTKNLVTAEGGMITTDNKEYADKIKMYALHGMDKDAWKRYSDEGYKHYQVIFPGFKYNMTDIQAALGIHQLLKLEQRYKRREQIWNTYNEAFKDLPLHTPTPPEEGTRHAIHLYTILLDLDNLNTDRDEVLNGLIRENIGTGVHYTALHLHPYYQNTYNYKLGDFPNAEYISDRTISLPLSAKLTDKDVEDVIRAVTKIFNHFSK
jgi:dTDP-4-amino-4,6-dideoxygalactose transaminase